MKKLSRYKDVQPSIALDVEKNKRMSGYCKEKKVEK
jgi:hypothetical protein